MDGGALYDRYEAIFEGFEAPFAFVDLDALDANADAMLARAGGKPIRVASKSVRCRAVLERVAARGAGFQGVLCFTVPEALMLAEAGHRDLLVAYPSADRQAISRLAELEAAEPGAAPVLMVDEAAQLDLIEFAVGRGPTSSRSRSTSTSASGRSAAACRSAPSAPRSAPRRRLGASPRRSPGDRASSWSG